MSKQIEKYYMDRAYALDNFSPFAIHVKQYFTDLNIFFGLALTVEHAYQAMKFLGNFADFGFSEMEDELDLPFINIANTAKKIINSLSAHEAKEIARLNKEFRRKDWDEIKEDVMRKFLNLKFEQHPYVRKTLARSFGQTLIENSPDDDFWGIAWRAGHIGKNRQGEIWMEIQKENENCLREEFPEDFGIWISG